MGVINFAHGEFVMLGAYMAWLGGHMWNVDPFVSAPVVFAFMALLGCAVQLLLVNRVIDRPHLVSLLVMFGVAIIMQNSMKLAFHTADFRRTDTALDGSWRIADGLTVPVTKFWILVVALGVLGCLSAFLHRSRLGKSIRAGRAEPRSGRAWWAST